VKKLTSKSARPQKKRKSTVANSLFMSCDAGAGRGGREASRGDAIGVSDGVANGVATGAARSADGATSATPKLGSRMSTTYSVLVERSQTKLRSA